jgi:O-methyltransferase
MHVDHQIQEMAQRQEFFRRAMTALWCNSITGDYAEFGCYGATTFRLAYQESRKFDYKPMLWAFDSFQGLPEAKNDHPRWVPGGMAMDQATFVATLDYHGVPRDAYEVVPGFYSNTLGSANPQAEAYCRDIALAYVDCDLYDSSVAVFEFLKPRIKHGMIIALDDYHCWWPEGIPGERLAMLEMVRDLDSEFNFVPFMQFGWHGQSFFVEARKFLKGLTPCGHF